MSRLPESITESELLAFIEADGRGSSLAPDREAAVRRAVNADPELAQLVIQMRSDAAALVSMGSSVKAPEGLLDAVSDQLESAHATEWSTIREPHVPQITRSSVVFRRQSPLAQLLSGRSLTRFAIAASLLMAVGIGVWVISTAISSTTKRQNNDLAKITRRDATPSHDPASNEVAVTAPSTSDRSSPELALQGPRTEDDFGFPGPTSIPDAPRIAQAAPAPTIAGLPVDQALELARAGRLVIKVRAASVDAAAQEIKLVAQRTSKELDWRPLEPWQLREVTVAMTPRARPDTPVASKDAPPPPSAATTTTPPPITPVITPTGPAADIAAALKRLTEFRPVYAVELDQNERELAALLAKLTKGSAQVAELVAVDSPMPTLAPSADPAAVLWWSRPPANWVRRVCIPVVVESTR